jgi:mRNA-degrading endonuclease YafQ of YafQ-DinJ toxin-antitoxin module
MTVRYHSRFLKVFEKLPPAIQEKFFSRLRLFQREPFHPLLNNHSVDTAYPRWRSINVTGDYRALFEQVDDDTIVFMKIGTHSEL